MSSEWRAHMTVFLIILFFVPPLFLLAYKLGEHVRDLYFTEQTESKGDPGPQLESANCGENFETALQQDQWWLVKQLPESEEEAQEALSQIRAARLHTCHDLGYR